MGPDGDWGAAASPVGGLRHLLRTARTELPGHTLALLIEGLDKACAKREKKEFKHAGVDGFSRRPVEAAVARLAVATPGVRVTEVPDFPAGARAIVLDHFSGAYTFVHSLGSHPTRLICDVNCFQGLKSFTAM